MALTGIIEGGSSKTDFVFLDQNKEVVQSFQTKGFNPLMISKELILSELNEHSVIQNIQNEVLNVYYYGAGIGDRNRKNIIHHVLKKIFTNAEVDVKSDLFAAAYALYQDRTNLVAILGTGCNICFFDGKEIHKHNPSLGYILSDEGSGNHIGRILLKYYFAQKFPANLQKLFNDEFDLNPSHILENVYQKPAANAYLAKFTKFAVKNQDDLFIKNIVEKCFQEFFDFQVYPYHVQSSKEINFVGSIAALFRKSLENIADKNGYYIGKILQKPIDDLVRYHQNL